MKVKIDFLKGEIYVNSRPFKGGKFRPNKSVLKDLASDINRTIKAFVNENNLQVLKEVYAEKHFIPKDRKHGRWESIPWKTIYKAGLYAEKPEVISIFNFRYHHNTWVIHDDKLSRQIENLILYKLSHV